MNYQVSRVKSNAVFVYQFAALCILLAGSCGAAAQMPSQFRSFSANQIEVTGRTTKTGKVYSSEKGVRVESSRTEKPVITIMRLDQKAVWVLNPDSKTYMDMGGLGAMGMEMAHAAEGVKTEREAMGSEQVGEYHCDKYHVQTAFEGHVYKSLEWDAKELGGFPVKQAGEKGEWSKEYQNVKVGPQDPSLFEVPADYQKMDLGGMFKHK